MTEAGQKRVRNCCLNTCARGRRKKGSHHHQKAARYGATTHLTMARQRQDCHVKAATLAVESSDRIVVLDVALTNLVKTHFLAFSIAQSHQHSPEAD